MKTTILKREGSNNHLSSMRIAFIHLSAPSAEGTGATHSATQIVYGLADLGHEVDAYCPRYFPNESRECCLNATKHHFQMIWRSVSVVAAA
jgi:hypothetical protein